MMVNPQWKPGQVISDFGFGVLRKIRQDYVDTFADVFFMKRINVFSDAVILLRCYPFDWQVRFPFICFHSVFSRECSLRSNLPS